MKEFIYYDMPQAVADYMIADGIEKGEAKFIDPLDFKVKPIEFTMTNDETGETTSYDYDEDIITVKVLKQYDLDTDKLVKTVYITDTEEEMIRLAYSEKKIGATVAMDSAGEISYRYYNQGYETERFMNLLYVLHNETPDTLKAVSDNQVVRKLGNIEMLNPRENMVPVFTVFMGSLMGFFIVMAYIFLDKHEGVIRAFAVTPSSVWTYLISKTMVIITTVLISSSIIVIPVMGGQAKYLLLYPFLIITTFTFASLGLLVSSFFDSISKAFGVLYAFMILMMIPAFSYYIPSFDPVWLRFFPTYPMLQGIKEIIMAEGSVSYILMYSGVFLVVGVVLFLLANLRFKKTLTV